MNTSVIIALLLLLLCYDKFKIFYYNYLSYFLSCVLSFSYCKDGKKNKLWLLFNV